MKVLLKEDVEHVGSVGDEVDVKDGFARNFLIPRGKALHATPKNVKAYTHQKMVVMKRLKKLQAGAQEVADKIAALTCTVKKKVGEQGKLFGSVTSQEIGDFLRAQGVNIDRRRIQLSEPIKKLGEFEVPVKLHPEVTGKIKVVVESEDPEPEAPAAEAAEEVETNTEAPEEETTAEKETEE
ncbi:MAG: 50S ribosomal protein L9 [Candidatus Nitronauta litoralis]|uniref:Large ribosomal subunit protein bL9 n=1 Tax=Candidatus Nitronauta litoralis TaxID=2705533 RepID=A0A7T0G1Y6_9BACT|nr:MAG: 50S ribosomal protein L9 [Candidatus Nitronauta litoralis]